jgi:tetratricopeptide (TPR) repeat protein
MKKILVILCVFMLVPVLGQELPFSETVELKMYEDLYELEKIVTIYIKEDGTYTPESRIVSVNIAPQEYCYAEGQHLKDFFASILVSIVIATPDGKTSDEFLSYLNFDLSERSLFWDHAGHSRADSAGELFGEDTTVTVEDTDIEVTLALTHLLLSEYNCSNCDTDAASYITFIDIIRFRLEVTYTQSQKDTIEQMEEDLEKYGDAQENVALAREYFGQQEFKKAKEEYEKAKDIFDSTGDTENADEMQEWIDKCTSYDVATENFKEGIDSFEEAARTNDFQVAIQTYEEARSYFTRAKTEFDYVEDTTQSDACDTWIERCNDEIDNLGDVGTLRGRLIYIVLAIVVIAGAGILLKQLGKGKGKGKGKEKGKGVKSAAKGITLTVQNAETGERTTVTVERTDKIGKVRQLAATNLGVIPSDLLYKEKVCPPAWTVEECGLTDGAAVEIIPKGLEPEPRDERAEKLRELEQRYKAGRISKELYESLKRRLEKE